MVEEEQNLNDLERMLQVYFRAEDQELDYPSGLWDQLAPRLGEQRRRGWVQRVPAISWIIPTWPPTSILRILGPSRARQAMAASMAFLLLIGIGYLGVTLTLVLGAGHFNESTGFKEFPLLLEKLAPWLEE